jgi:hypothetical protein
VLYLNDGHDLFAWTPFAADLEPALATEIAKREGWYGSPGSDPGRPPHDRLLGRAMASPALRKLFAGRCVG